MSYNPFNPVGLIASGLMPFFMVVGMWFLVTGFEVTHRRPIRWTILAVVVLWSLGGLAAIIAIQTV